MGVKTKVVPGDRREADHRSDRAGWLRAAVLGSDDAVVSTASLMIGVAASSASKGAILVAGVAGLVAGSMSMAVGEFVSVSSQRDAEKADVALEKKELDGKHLQAMEEAASANASARLRPLQTAGESGGLTGSITCSLGYPAKG